MVTYQFHFVRIFVIFGGLILFLFLWTSAFADAYVRAIGSAREPAHRVTPLSPWRFFDRIFWKRLRPRLIIPTLMLVGFLALPFLVGKDIATPHRRVFVWKVLTYAAILLGLLQMVFLQCSIWVPRCRKRWALSALGFLSGLPTYCIGLVALHYGVLKWLPRAFCTLTLEVTVQMPSGGVAPVASYFIPLLPFYWLPIGAALICLYWRALRRQGDRWFRFER